MIKGNMHTHSTFCDGRDTPEEMVISAIAKGFKVLGFSGHSELPNCEDWCMMGNTAELYRSEISRLKRVYKDKIKIFCGVEQDYFSETPVDCYDFVIGSVHCIKKGNELLPVDSTKEEFMEYSKKYYNNDIYKMVEEYYELVSDVVNKTNCDIIGHFDLITKFNKNNGVFDENNPRYINAAKKCALSLIKTGKLFEINTGGIARGYLDRPYPSLDLINYIAENGGKLILTSDCHDKRNLEFGFDDYISYADTMTLDIE